MEYYQEYLQHHGVPGMRWGVRRYQNKDGTLTAKGKARVEEGATLFPKRNGKLLPYKSKYSKYRDAVTEKIIDDKYEESSKIVNKAYTDYIKKHPDFVNKDPLPFDYWRANIKDKNLTSDVDKKYAKRFIDEYSNATLKDLGLEITPASKKFAEDVLRKNDVML